MVAALTNESATSKSVYFALCTSEMIYITHLLEEEPEKLAGPLLADTYVTLLKGRNAWYGHRLAKGELTLEMGDSIKGKGTIQVCPFHFDCYLNFQVLRQCPSRHQVCQFVPCRF
jgi:glycerol-3-phosphate dehydrogenase (NAD+)